MRMELQIGVAILQVFTFLHMGRFPVLTSQPERSDRINYPGRNA
jgi:hypothetical protein